MGEHLLYVGNCARCFTHYLIELSQNFPQVGLISLHFQTRKLRFREGMYYTQGHTENKWRDLVLNPGVSVTEGPPFLLVRFDWGGEGEEGRERGESRRGMVNALTE